MAVTLFTSAAGGYQQKPIAVNPHTKDSPGDNLHNLDKCTPA